MMQAGIFTGYFPYGLEETARKIRDLDFNTVQLDLLFKDVDLSAGQITKEKAKKVRNALATRICRSAASPAIRTLSIPTRQREGSASDI
jgi:sugar phosphate isomerase/epimerase